MTQAPPNEQVVLLDCEGDRLLAILSEPAEGFARRLGVVIVVGGPQYRAGSHRQFVQTARALAARGYPTLRFDVRGMGDSTGEPRDFEHLSADIGAAVDGLMAAQVDLSGVVLWGLCDGASAALLYQHERQDPRVAGLALANPWVRTEVTLARTRLKHYYLSRLLDTGFWKKLLTGGVGMRSIADLWSSVAGATATPRSTPETTAPTPHYTQRMQAAACRPGEQLLVLLSGRDYTAKEFAEFVAGSPAWKAKLGSGEMVLAELADADHTFSGPEDLSLAIEETSAWLDARCASKAAEHRHHPSLGAHS